MAHETIDGTYRQTNLTNESAEYLAKREELRLAEIELRNQREKVATLRRQLPPGATLKDYEFIQGPASLDAGDAPTRKVRLTELFTAPDRALVIYQFMFGKKQTNHARCAPRGSIAGMALRITWHRMSTWRLWLRPICLRCVRTHVTEAGTNYVC